MPKQISTPLTTLKQISHLCATLQLVCEGMGCLGALTDQRKKRYAIHAVRRHPRALASQDIVSLKDLLSTPAPKTALASPALKVHHTKQERLQLALILASTMLQLHTTPWLNERWGKSDIRFLRQPGGSRAPLIEQPYISKSFRSSKALHSTCAVSNKSPSASVIRNKSVFDLGVLLIELYYNKSLEQMQTPEDLDDNGKVNAYTSLVTANRLIPEVYAEAGVRYGHAVRRCSALPSCGCRYLELPDANTQAVLGCLQETDCNDSGIPRKYVRRHCPISHVYDKTGALSQRTVRMQSLWNRSRMGA